MLVKMETGASGGGGVDISDLIGNTYSMTAYSNNVVEQYTFLAGIKTVEVWTNSGNCGLYTDKNKSDTIATVSTTHQTVDVSNHNIAFCNAISAGYVTLNIKVID